MSVDHELAHHFVSQRLGWPCSFVVWHDAHSTEWPPRDAPFKAIHDFEEHMCVSIARYINNRELDDYGQLEEAFGRDLNRVANELMALWARVP